MEGISFLGWSCDYGEGSFAELTAGKTVEQDMVFHAELQDASLAPSYAIYSETDDSLTFYKNYEAVAAGDTYRGKVVTSIYKDVESCAEELDESNQLWNDVAGEVKSVVFADTLTPKSTAWWFYDFSKCTLFDLRKLDTSQVTSMAGMFMNAGDSVSETTFPGLEDFNTSMVKYMDYMFYAAGLMNEHFSIDLSRWDVSSLESAMLMFSKAGGESRTFSLGDLGNWNTKSLRYSDGMFEEAGSSAISWYIGTLGRRLVTTEDGYYYSWNLSHLETMERMFYMAAENAQEVCLDLSLWNLSSVISLSEVFYSFGKNATSWSIGNLGTKSVALSDGTKYMAWNVMQVYTLESCFEYAGHSTETFSLGRLDNWDLSDASDLSRFLYCAGYSADTFTIGDLSNWDVSRVYRFDEMFAYAGYSADTFTIGDLSDWDVSEGTGFQGMFRGTGANADGWLIDCRRWPVTTGHRVSYFNEKVEDKVLEPLWDAS